RAGRFGVIAISQRSIARHRRYLLQMGLTDRLAGERPLEMSVAETASGEQTLRRMVDVGRQLKERDGAEAVIMGCAGMARHRRPLEAALGIPVIDPTQAAVTMAFRALQFCGAFRLFRRPAQPAATPSCENRPQAIWPGRREHIRVERGGQVWRAVAG